MKAKQRIIGLTLILIISVVGSFFIGGVEVNWRHFLEILSGDSDSSSVEAFVLQSIRIPRSLGAVLVGAALAGGGLALQSLFRNPLADPSIIGISSGASAMAVFVIAMGGSSLVIFGLSVGVYTLPIAAFGGALITAVVAYRMSLSNRQADTSILLLAGIALQFLAGAITSLLIFTSNDQELRNITFWMMGSMAQLTWTNLAILLIFVLPLFIYLPLIARKLNMLQLGEEQAYSLGVETSKLKQRVILLTTLAVGATVAFCGIVSFIGLVAPHIMRLWFGHQHQRLIPATLVFGAVLNLIADSLARTIALPEELPISIITAMLGAPVFIALIIRERKKIALA